MADTKISALTAATTPLAGTEVLPIVQSGSTVKVSVANLTSGRNIAVGTSPSTTNAALTLGGTTGEYAAYFGGNVGNGANPTTDRGLNIGWNRSGGQGETAMVWGTGAGANPNLQIYSWDGSTITERVRVGATTGDVTAQTGNLVIGTSGKGLTTGGSFALGFGTNGSTSQATLNTSGYLLLGTSTANNRITVGGTSSTGRVVPATDNVGYVGDGNYRWQAIYAVNGTIQTSDGRQKNTIEDSNLGLAFVNTLRPVSYKWNVGENIVTYDDEGNEIATPRPGIRVHYGFIAQEVQAAIPQGVDFGGFVHDAESDTMSLRYHEFIAPMVKAIQELKNELDSIKAELQALKG